MKYVLRLAMLIAIVLVGIGDSVLYVLRAPLRLFRTMQTVLRLPRFARKPKTVEVFNAKYLRAKLSPIHTAKSKKKHSLFPLRRFFMRKQVQKKAHRSPRLTWRRREKEKVKVKVKVKRMIVHRFPLLAKLKYFFIGIFFSALFVFLPLLFFIFLQDLPNPKIISSGHIPQTTKIYDRSGTLLYQIYAQSNRTLVPLENIPQTLQLATIAVEDAKFYTHPGFDTLAIVRSAFTNLSGNGLQGGSTITQQLIKSALFTPEPNVYRKVKEVVLAFWAERIYTKPQILSMYFNQIPYGRTAYGAEAASEVYFGKNVKDLTLSESAFLAGITKAPTLYDPLGPNQNAWKKRQKEVLDRMVTLGYISREKADEAHKEELTFRLPQTPLAAPHFVMYVRDFLVRKYGLPLVEKGGLTVVTSIDLAIQDIAQKIVTDEVEANAHLAINNGAALITNPKNGDILAMVGSRDFNDEDGGKVNATTSLRQPGSTIKIITYSAALSNGFTAATILDDSPVTYTVAPGLPTYTPVNYDGRFFGRLPLRQAFANSLNIPAVKTLYQIGVPTFVRLGKKMGIKSWNGKGQYGLPITLGSAEVTMLDLASVYDTVANGGVRLDVNPILKITDYKGAVLEEKAATIGEPVLDEGVAFIISDILADNKAREKAFGQNSTLVIPGKTVSVKTGTSDNKRDNWTIGYTPSLAVATWVGNLDGTPMDQRLASGVSGAAPMWNKIMANLLSGRPDERPRVPANIVARSCFGRIEYFLRGTETTLNCPPPPKPQATDAPKPTPTP